MLRKMIDGLIQLIYYFFNGLLFLVLILPNLIIKFINKIGRSGIKLIVPTKKTVFILIGICSFVVYFSGVYFFTRFYVQQERCRVFAEDILESTKKIEKIEKVAKEETEVENQQEQTIQPEVIESNVNSSNYSSGYTYSYTDFMNINVNNYTHINQDIVGWLKVEGTSVNYLTVQAGDNDFYLDHDLNKNSSLTDWLFGDYRNNFNELDKNTIIYGHNMANGTMFGTLIRAVNPWWYKATKNQYIKFNTRNSKMVWQIFSIYEIDPVVDYLQTVFASDNQYLTFLNTMKSRSIYNFNVDLNSNDKILTLQTCDNSGAKRIIVQAKLYKQENY